MVKMKISAIVLISIVSTSLLFADFTLIESSEGKIVIKYSKSASDNSKTILLPPDAKYTAKVSGGLKVSDVCGKPFYFKDYYLLPVIPSEKDYLLTITFNRSKQSGRIVKPSQSEINTVSDLIVNKKNMTEYLKGREIKSKKSGYDGTPVSKIRISETGMYRIYYDEILNETGNNLSSYNPSTIKLYCDGSEIPLFIYGTGDNSFNAGDYFEFFGTRESGINTYYNKYDLKNVYVIVAGGGNGSRYVIDNNPLLNDSLIDDTIFSFLKTVHLEEDSFYKQFGGQTSIDTSDFWYMSSVSSVDTYFVGIQLENRDTLNNNVNIRGYFHGFNFNTLFNPDHSADFLYNDSIYSHFEWEHVSPYLFTYNSLKITDSNSVNFGFIINNIDTFTNVVGVNWIECDYAQELKSENGAFLFSLDDSRGFGTFRYVVKGFDNTNISVYRKDLKKIEGYTTWFDSSTGKYNVKFDDDVYSTNRDYYVCQSSSFLSADTIENYATANLSDISLKGEYIVIVNSKLKSSAEAFAALFENEHTVVLAGTEEIYNEFGNGKKSAYAIKEFLKTAYNNWLIPPADVLLLGDGSYDNNNHRNVFTNDIPVAFYYESMGMICSDNYYVSVSGDDPVEDISISRFPARDENDIYTAVNKVAHYSDWRNNGLHDLRVVLAYDTIGPDGEDYLDAKYESFILASMLPNYMYPEYMPNKYDQNGDFINQLIYGTSYMNFYAHGAEQSVGYGVYLRLHDIFRIYNIDRMPFVSIFSCVTGFFDEVKYDSMSLGEAFVVSPYGGAIAYYGSATISEASSNHMLGGNLFRQFSQNGVRNIGEIALYGELEFFIQKNGFVSGDDSPAANQIKNYGLLGINLVDLKIPEVSEKICSLSSYSLNPQDTLQIYLSDSSLENGNMQSLLIDADSRCIAKTQGEIYSGYGENTLMMPDSIVIGGLTAVTMGITQDTSLLYISYPSVQSGGLKSFYIQPASPDTNESIMIFAKKGNDSNIKNILAVFKYPSEYGYQSSYMYKDSIDTLLYHTKYLSPIKPTIDKNTSFSYYISYSDTLEANFYSTSVKNINIPPYPRMVVNSAQYINPADNKPMLTLDIKNSGERDIKGLIVEFNEVLGADTNILGTDTLDISGNSVASSSIALNKRVYGSTLLAFVNKNNLYEIGVTNIISNNFDYDYFYVYDKPLDSLFQYVDINIKSQGNSYGDTNLAVIARQEFVQTGQGLIPQSSVKKTDYIYEIIISDTVMNTEIGIFADSVLESNGILKYDEDNKKFRVIDDLSSDTAFVKLDSRSSKYLIADWTDTVAPEISILIENKEYSGGVVLTNNVNFGITVEDNEGVFLDKMLVIVGEDTLKAGDYTILDNAKDNSLPIKFTKTFENGTFKVKIIAYDYYNNKSEKELSFIVSNQFKFLSVANFPNPVRADNTLIVCEFSQHPSSVVLSIFSADGKLIERAVPSLMYDERFSYNLNVSKYANGTYFYKIEAELDKEKIKSAIMKMSVLR